MRFLRGIRKILRRPHLSIVALRLPPLTTHCDARARYSDVNNELATALGRRGGLPQAHDVAFGVFEVSRES